jgi:hypothetical protein
MRPALVRVILSLLVTLPMACGPSRINPSALRDGDIVFQTSRSSQSRAIQLATRSAYSHMGILFLRNEQWMVYEAVQPVKWTPFERWVQRGVGGHVVVKRLKEGERRLTPQILARMKAVGSRFQGRPYDLTFEWSDDRLYCSELVWKIYKEGAGIELGSLQVLGDFDLSHPAVQAKLQERFHGQPPLDEPVISPQRMFESPELETIVQR